MYILNRKWLKKWKEYVDYPFIKRKFQYTYYYSNRVKEYKINEESFPGAIDNSRILVPLNDFLNDGNSSNEVNLVIRDDLQQREDIKICHKKIWDFFNTRYPGGPSIIRSWINEGSSYSSKFVELFYRSVNVIALPPRKTLGRESINNMDPKKIYISRNKSLADVKNQYVEIFNKNNLLKNSVYNQNITEENIKLWKIESNSSLEKFKEFLIDKMEILNGSQDLINCEDYLEFLEYLPKICLRELEFADTDICIVEISDETNQSSFEIKKIDIKEGKCENCNSRKMLRYFCVCKEVAYCTASCKDRDSRYHENRCRNRFEIEEDSIKLTSQSKKGLVGLQNLGNTCFMNTSLQCMSNCYELTKYFLNDKFKAHINLDNPIGTQGVLAKAYSNLLKNIWFGSSGVYSPWNFKSAIATFQSMFTGYQQHDTQEFLNYLLDGLHEDLNKVLKKPLVEKDDTKKEDKIKSNEQWIGYLRRNQSVLVDILYGQFKSTLYCPDSKCQNISTTFDPFLSLSLPLAKSEDKYDVICYYIFHNLKISPIQINLTFYSETTVIALRNKIGKLLDIHPFSFMIMKMDSLGYLDLLVNSSMLVKMNINRLHKNQLAFFCFQINPDIFNEKKNSNYSDLDSYNKDYENLLENLEKSKEEKRYLFTEEYQEDCTGLTKEDICYYSYFNIKNNGEIRAVKLKINTDNNNGLTDEWIRLLINMNKYDDSLSEIRKKLIFPRIIFINKNWSTKRLHSEILNYFSLILKSFHNINNDEIWDDFFPDLEEICSKNDNLTQDQHRKKAYPYLIRIKNIFTEMGGQCIFCDRKNCDDCLLPCSDNITVQQLLDKIPLNADLCIDNSYNYMNEKQKNICSLKDSDFAIDVCWLSQYITEVKKLNDKKDFEMEFRRSNKEDVVNIYKCFKNFVSLEKLEENNEWYCPQCKNHQRAEKRMEIYKSPHILVIHLKRFRNHKKIENLVDFPVSGLDISNYVIHKENGVDLVYDLFAIANHVGGLGGGHYYAYAKNYFDNQWYCFNDSSVSKISESELVTSGAYVLFYRRRNLSNIPDMEKIYDKNFEDYENLSIINNLTLNSEKKNKMDTDS